MRKGLTTFLVILLALGAVLVSCKAEIEAPADELVAVSFEERTSRALSATLEAFNKNELFWSYAARKNASDTSGLTSGTTANYDESAEARRAGAKPVQVGPGLKDSTDNKPVQVSGFSQGIWDFTLYAYKNEERTQLVYQGEATAVVLQKGSDNNVSVIVSPATSGNGTLVIGATSLNPKLAADADHYTVARTFSVTPVGETDPIVVTGTTIELPAGAYSVNVTYMSQGIVYAEGMVIATVYPGLKTTVTGSVDELVTFAQFEADINPDLIRETIGAEITSESDGLIQLESTETTKTSATIDAETAKDLMSDLAKDVGADSTSKMALSLKVNTSEITETAATYDISLEAVLTYSKNGKSSTATSDVKSIEDYMTITIDLESDITSATVKHSGLAMIPTDNISIAGDPEYESDPQYVGDVNHGTDDDPLWVGFYKFDDDNKKLYIKTKSFSPFEVIYTMTEYVASISGTKYKTLSDAYVAVQNGQTIVFLKNITSGLTVNNGKTFTIDLGGNEWSGYFNLKNGFVTLQNGEKTGVYAIEVATSADSSLEAGEYNRLTIGSDLTVGGNYSLILWAAAGNVGYGSRIDINGTLTAWIWVFGTITNDKGNCIINLNDGAKTANIALQGYAILNVNEGATVIGRVDKEASAIEVRAGVLNVNGGTITCLYQPTAAEQNNNGTSTKGAGVGISQYNNSSIEVNFNGGTITGDSGLYWTNTFTDEQIKKTTVNLPLGWESTAMFVGKNEDYRVNISQTINLDSDLNTVTNWIFVGAEPVSGAPLNPPIIPGL